MPFNYLFFIQFQIIIPYFSCCFGLPGCGVQCVHRAGQCGRVDLLHPGAGQGLGGGPGLVEGPRQERRQGGDPLRGAVPHHLGRSVFQTRVAMFTSLQMVQTVNAKNLLGKNVMMYRCRLSPQYILSIENRSHSFTPFYSVNEFYFFRRASYTRCWQVG